MSESPEAEDIKLFEQEKFLMSLPEDVRKYYVKTGKKRTGSRGVADYAIPPIREDVKLYLIIDPECKHCSEFMVTNCFQAIVRYLWARGIKFNMINPDEARFLLFKYGQLLPDSSKHIQNLPDGSSLWSPISTPSILILKKGRMFIEMIDMNVVREKPLYYFYRVQRMVEDEIIIPSISMALNLRKLQDAYRTKKKKEKEKELDLELEEEELEKASSLKSIDEGVEVRPCETQPRC